MGPENCKPLISLLSTEPEQRTRTRTDYHNRPGQWSRRILVEIMKTASPRTATALVEGGVRRGSLSSLIRMKSTADIHKTINRIFVSSDVHVRNVVVFIKKSTFCVSRSSPCVFVYCMLCHVFTPKHYSHWSCMSGDLNLLKLRHPFLELVFVQPISYCHSIYYN